MAHEIRDNMMFSVRQTPWHRQGVVLDHAPTTEEAILAAKLDWEVKKVPNYVHVDGRYIETESRSIVRMSERGPIILGTVSDRYEPVQNREAFTVFDRLMQESGYTYETAGAVKNGRKVWILARAAEGARVGDDDIRQYVAIITSHDGTMNLRLLPTAVRIVCNNTLTWALQRGEEEGFTLRHTPSIHEKLDIAAKLLAATQMSFAQAVQVFSHMQDTRIEPAEAIRYWERVIPSLRRRGDSNSWRLAFDNIANAFLYGRGNKGETLWHAYNAMTEWVDHIRNTAGHRILDYAVFGEGGRIKRDGIAHAREIIADRVFAGPPLVSAN